MPHITTCAHCGKQFSKSPSQITRRFCSRTCYNAAHAAPMTTATCKVCGKVFEIKQCYDGRYTYCSDDCRKSLNQPRVCGVYMIECLANGMVYIGSSVHINRRWRGHRSKLNSGTHENPHLQQDYAAYGPDNFRYAILGITTKPNLTRLEQTFLDDAMARGICYNVFPNTETALGRTFSPEQRREISRRNKGRIFTKEHRDKLSEASKGRPKPSYVIEAMRQANAGRKATTEQRKAQSQRVRGSGNGRAKLTESDIRAIKKLFSQGVKPAAIARQFGIGKSQVGRIKKGEQWAHIT